MNKHEPSFESVYKVIRKYYDTKPTFDEFTREVIGIDGIIRRSFLSIESRNKFYNSEFGLVTIKLAYYLLDLSCQRELKQKNQPKKIITVRTSRSMRELLNREAHEQNISLNQLCLRKLLIQQNPQEEIERRINERLPTNTQTKVS